MDASNSSLLTAMAIVLAAVALLGYLAGHDRSPGRSREKSHTLAAAGVLLAYPSDWQPASAAGEIPGLSLAHQAVLAPDGEAAHAGLLTGQIPGNEPSLLPRRFMTQMRSLPDTEIVELVGTQAYRYARVNVKGFDRMLSIYAIPSPGGNPTVLACYASPAFSVAMRECAQIVARLTLVGQQPSYNLTPEAEYGRKLSASIGALSRERVGLRRELGTGASPLTTQRLATRLAAGFAHAAASLALLTPSPTTVQAQTMLARSILRTSEAYAALAAAATAESPSRAASAERQVDETETEVDTVLEGFALLGYRT